MIRHCYYSPVAIVIPISDSVDSEGSDSVDLIRNYFEQTIEREGLTQFVLDSIGPSPFHANFSIRERKADGAPSASMTMVDIAQRGYDNIIWHVDTEQMPFDIAATKGFDGIRHDADVFYEIMQRHSGLLHSWAEASHLAHAVMNMEEKRAIRSRVRNYPKKSRRIGDAIISVAEHQMGDIGARAAIISILNEHLWAEDGGIRRFCEREFHGLEKFPATELRELLQFLENRVRHVDNVLIALLAAMLGGLVGGALGVVAS